MDLKQENQLIKWDAEYALKECEKRADSRYSSSKSFLKWQGIKAILDRYYFSTNIYF